MFQRRPGTWRAFHLGVNRRDLVDADMDAELRFHLEARIAHLVARGMPPADARTEALRRLGSTVEGVRTQLHHSAQRKERVMARHQWIADVRQDMTYAVRGLARRPGFTLVAVLTLAIGIGANTAIFSAVRALLLRALPFPRPAELVDISLTTAPRTEQQVATKGRGPVLGEPNPWSWPKYELYRDQQRSMREVALWRERQVTLTSGDAERVDAEDVSARYLATLGIQPAHGRDFDPALDRGRGVARHVLISDALWTRRFNADPQVIGAVLEIDRLPYEVIGVLPPGARGLSGKGEVFIPITTQSADDLSEPWSLEYSQVGRLAPGITVAQAAAEAFALGARIYDAHPMTGKMAARIGGEWRATVRSLDGLRVAAPIRRSLFVLFGAVAFVLLIACVNLANLLMGRASVRQREIAIRLAIGAGRARLVRFLLAESVVLALLGGIASVFVAWWGTRALSLVNPASALQAQNLSGLGVVSFASIRLDAWALVFTLGVALVVGLAFGLVPALQATRAGMQQQLKTVDGGMTSGGRMRMITTRRVLVVAEMAMAIVLLAGAGVMIRSLDRLLRVNTGFDATNVLTVRLNVPFSQVPRDSLPGFYQQLLARLAAMPGATSVALGDCPPLNGGCNATIIELKDRPPVQSAEAPTVGVHWVTPGWFTTLRVPLKRGRLFTDADRLGSEKVVLLNEAAARKYWPDADPIGKQVAVFQGGFHTGATVVGIVGDVQFGTIDSVAVPDAYISYEQSPQARMMIYLRTSGDPESLVAPVRAAVRELSPSYPAYDVRTLASRVAVASTQARVSATLLGLFATIALTLATIGIYGVMSFAVTQRSRELGIRMALGADRATVLRLVVGEGLRLALTGAVLGLALALALSGVLRSLLYGVSPTDPFSYALMLTVLVGAACLASWLPARRASRVDPAGALRS